MGESGHEDFQTDEQAAFVRVCKWRKSVPGDPFIGWWAACVGWIAPPVPIPKDCPYCGRKIEVVR